MHAQFPAHTLVDAAGMERSTAAAPARVVAMGWIKGPAWDFAWVLNALWLAPLLHRLASGPPCRTDRSGVAVPCCGCNRSRLSGSGLRALIVAARHTAHDSPVD